MSRNKEVIITAFGPFGDVTSNPTEKLINSLKEELQDELYRLFVLPVSYSYCSNWVKDHISAESSLVIHFGVSAKSKIIQLERTGRNLVGSSADVDGKFLQGKIVAEEIGSIQSGLDLNSLKANLNSKGFPCDVSDDAGDYLCNFILFKSLCVAPRRTLFVHVPPEEEMSIGALKAFTLELLRSLQDQVK